MKKITLLTVTMLTVMGLGAPSMAAQAAPVGQSASVAYAGRSLIQSAPATYAGKTTAQASRVNTIQSCINGNKVIISYGGNCNIQDILDKFENCFPNLELPGIQLPECETPDNNTPEVESPGTGSPEENAPENNVPETDAPETNLPGNNTPENNNPGNNNSGNGSTSPEAPEQTPENDSSNDNNASDNNSNENVHPYVQQVVDLVNAERAKEGLSPLKLDTKVSAAAQVRAKECEQLFSHTRPNGSSFATALKEQNISYRSAGENIAWGQRSPEVVVNAWMNSAGHRANIMNANFTTIGVGYYRNASGTNYWCQLFTR